MNTPIHDNNINRFVLKPRFQIDLNKTQKDVIQLFRDNLNSADCKYYSRIVKHHVIIDIPDGENHFWSPQLDIEVEEATDTTTRVRGLFGPKPQVWTFFMFLHFAVAISFMIFLVMAYSNYALEKDYGFALMMCIILPIIWIVFYIFGQLGKKKGYKQMVELHDYMEGILKSKAL